MGYFTSESSLSPSLALVVIVRTSFSDIFPKYPTFQKISAIVSVSAGRVRRKLSVPVNFPYYHNDAVKRESVNKKRFGCYPGFNFKKKIFSGSRKLSDMFTLFQCGFITCILIWLKKQQFKQHLHFQEFQTRFANLSNIFILKVKTWLGGKVIQKKYYMDNF